MIDWNNIMFWLAGSYIYPLFGTQSRLNDKSIIRLEEKIGTQVPSGTMSLDHSTWQACEGGHWDKVRWKLLNRYIWLWEFHENEQEKVVFVHKRRMEAEKSNTKARTPYKGIIGPRNGNWCIVMVKVRLWHQTSWASALLHYIPVVRILSQLVNISILGLLHR